VKPVTKPFVSRADGYVKWLRAQVGPQLIYLVYTTALVFDEAGRILVQRRYDFDWLGLPGGALELGESLREGAKREAFEETGLHVEIDRLVGVFSHPDYNLLYPNGDQVQQWTVCVAGHPVGGDLHADGGETLQVEFIPVEDALPQFPPAYQAMIRAAQESPREAALEPVYSQEIRRPYFPILRERVGHAPIILPGAMAVIRNEAGEVLVARRNDDGLFDVPGGFCDLGETTSATVVRETFEETGLRVEPVRVIGVYSEGMEYTYPNGDAIHGVGIAIECRLIGGTIQADLNEVSEVAFKPLDYLDAQTGGLIGNMRLWHDIAHPETWPVLR
jgi:ADP-ribose pyrophosphatase YjhB (NUDIX family)